MPNEMSVPLERTILILLARVLLALVAGMPIAMAQTDEIQVYDAAIAPSGDFNLTLHNNYTRGGNSVPEYPASVVADRALNGVAEWAYGAAPWFEAGLYFPLYSITRRGSLLYNGFKLRALFVTPDAAKREVFYGVNFEFSFNTAHWDQRTYTSEIRPILGAHLGRFDFIFNPILDNAWHGFSKLNFQPATRIAMSVSERYKLAIEEYAEFGSLGHLLPAAKRSHSLFAVIDINARWFGLEAGVGAGLTPASDHRVYKVILTRDF